MKIDLHVHSKTGSDGKLTVAELFKEARSRNIGLLVHAHPNDPNGTSLISLTPDLNQQTEIIEKYMLNYIDGIECWHPKHDAETTAHYAGFARRQRLPSETDTSGHTGYT